MVMGWRSRSSRHTKAQYAGTKSYYSGTYLVDKVDWVERKVMIHTMAEVLGALHTGPWLFVTAMKTCAAIHVCLLHTASRFLREFKQTMTSEAIFPMY
jgi:hypothetical protein